MLLIQHEILQSHPLLMSRNFEARIYQWYRVQSLVQSNGLKV